MNDQRNYISGTNARQTQCLSPKQQIRKQLQIGEQQYDQYHNPDKHRNDQYCHQQQQQRSGITLRCFIKYFNAPKGLCSMPFIDYELKKVDNQVNFFGHTCNRDDINYTNVSNNVTSNNNTEIKSQVKKCSHDIGDDVFMINFPKEALYRDIVSIALNQLSKRTSCSCNNDCSSGREYHPGKIDVSFDNSIEVEGWLKLYNWLPIQYLSIIKDTRSTIGDVINETLTSQIVLIVHVYRLEPEQPQNTKPSSISAKTAMQASASLENVLTKQSPISLFTNSLFKHAPTICSSEICSKSFTPAKIGNSIFWQVSTKQSISRSDHTTTFAVTTLTTSTIVTETSSSVSLKTTSKIDKRYSNNLQLKINHQQSSATKYIKIDDSSGNTYTNFVNAYDDQPLDFSKKELDMCPPLLRLSSFSSNPQRSTVLSLSNFKPLSDSVNFMKTAFNNLKRNEKYYVESQVTNLPSKSTVSSSPSSISKFSSFMSYAQSSSTILSPLYSSSSSTSVQILHPTSQSTAFHSHYSVLPSFFYHPLQKQFQQRNLCQFPLQLNSLQQRCHQQNYRPYWQMLNECQIEQRYEQFIYLQNLFALTNNMIKSNIVACHRISIPNERIGFNGTNYNNFVDKMNQSDVLIDNINDVVQESNDINDHISLDDDILCNNINNNNNINNDDYFSGVFNKNNTIYHKNVPNDVINNSTDNDLTHFNVRDSQNFVWNSSIQTPSSVIKTSEMLESIKTDFKKPPEATNLHRFAVRNSNFNGENDYNNIDKRDDDYKIKHPGNSLKNIISDEVSFKAPASYKSINVHACETTSGGKTNFRVTNQNNSRIDHWKYQRFNLLKQNCCYASQNLQRKHQHIQQYFHHHKKRSRVFIDPLTEIPLLEKWFEEDTHPSTHMINRYTHILNDSPYRQRFPKLETKNLQLWFKNHRAKVKRTHQGNL